MTRLQTSFVLGYHGCDRSVAERAVEGDADLIQSDRDFDWLGPGAYFWEADPQRALEWAEWKAGRGDYEEPAVIGAVIDLRNCLDLVCRENLELLRAAYESFREVQRLADLPMPKNKKASGGDSDRLLRYLDCAVFRHLHSILDNQPPGGATIEPFDTVRGMFTEGGPLYPGCGFAEKSHVQLAVRNPECIKGIFYPRSIGRS